MVNFDNYSKGSFVGTFNVLDQYVLDRENHTDQYFDFEEYCHINYGVQPLHSVMSLIRNWMNLKSSLRKHVDVIQLNNNI